MSISSAPRRLASARFAQPRHVVGAVLLVIGLIVVVIAIANSATTTPSAASRFSARPRPISLTQSTSPAAATGAPVSSVPHGTFRDPVTHALLPADAPVAPQSEPGLGHR